MVEESEPISAAMKTLITVATFFGLFELMIMAVYAYKVFNGLEW